MQEFTELGGWMKSDELPHLPLALEILDNLDDAVVTTNAAYEVQSWNKGAEVLYGLAREDALGHPIDRLIHIEESEITREEIRRLVHEHGSWRGEVVHRTGTDRRIWVDWSVSLLSSPDGNVQGMISITKDIAKRRQLLDQLEESRNLFATFMENFPGLIFIKDHEFRYRYLNSFMLRSLAESSWIGRDAPAILDPFLAKKIRLMDENALKNGPSTYLDILPAKSGDLMNVQMCKFPIRRKDAPSLLGAIGLDITEITQIEAQRQDNEDRLRYALEASDSGLWDWNLANDICHFSPRFCTLLGYEPKELPPQFATWRQLVHPEDRARFDEVLETYLKRHQESFDVEVRLKAKNDSFRWSLIQGRLVERTPQGEPARMVGTQSDITRRREAEQALRESAELNEGLMNAMPDLIFRFDAEGRVVGYKPSEDIPTYVSPGDFLGGKAQDYLPPESAELFERTLRDALVTGKTKTIEYSLTVQGRKRSYEGRMASCGNDEVIMSIRDISERVELLEEQRRQQAHLQTVLQTIPDRLLVLDYEGTILESLGPARDDSQAPCFGDTPLNLFSLLDPHDARTCREAIRQTLETGTSQTVEYRFPTTEPVGWIEARTNLFQVSGHAANRILWMMRDITERKREEAEKLATLERGKKQQELLLKLATHPDLVNGQVIPFASVVCREAAELPGADVVSVWLLSRDRLQWHCQNEFIREINRMATDVRTLSLATPGFLRLLESRRVVVSLSPHGETPFSEIAPFFADQGRDKTILCAALRHAGRVEGVLILQKQGDFQSWADDEQAFAGTLADQLAQALTNQNRVQAEKERRETTRNMATLIRLIPDLVSFKDSEERYILVNQAFEKAFGLASRDIIGRRDQDIFLPDHVLRCRQTDEIVRTELRGVRYEERIALPCGDMHTFDTIKIPLLGTGKSFQGFASISRDITDRLRTEDNLQSSQEQLRQAQRMESIGRLAGGVAHDFNNLLTGITGNVSLMLMDVNPHDPLRESLEEIDKICDRAKDLTRQLLTFSRKQAMQPRVVNLNQILRDLKRMLQRSIGEDIELLTELDESIPFIKVDKGLLEQAILNLCVNARDAMPSGGRLILRTERRESTDPVTGEVTALAILHTKDNGIGMDEDTKNRIFDPFFTTKPISKGTGLGLSTVWGIVHQHGGELSVDTRPNEGAEFHLAFPETSERPSDEPETKRAGSETLPRGTETVLLVEDEEIAMTAAHRLLKRLGYQVIQARNGIDAQMREEMYNGPIHIMVTDIVMPKLNGRELAKILGTKRPDMKVLYLSGYAPQLIEEMGVDLKDLHFMAKPYSPPALAWKVRQVLSGQSADF